MEIRPIAAGDRLWQPVMDFAGGCSWRAGPHLAAQMRAGGFTDWERVIVALDGGRIAGYCTVAKTDCLPDAPYTPYIGYVFVDERYRGNALSGRMIACAKDYLRARGFQEVYLVSGERGLYEKYGFVKIADATDAWGNEEQVFCTALGAPQEETDKPSARSRADQ